MAYKYINGAVLTYLAVVSFNTHAALASADWKTVNDNLVTVDDYGLEWLDLTATDGFSYNYVSSQLGVGGEFEGWTFANTGQIEGLFDSAGGTGPYIGQNSANNGVVANLLSFWGDLSTTGGYSYFRTGNLDTVNSHWVGNVYEVGSFYYTDALLIINDYPEDNDVGDYGIGGIGSALVRASVIPIPPAAWLFCSGLIGLIGLAIRKKA